MFGLMGKILRVDLTSGKLHVEKIPEKMVKEYLGGRGLADKYLFDENKKGIDPLGPENRLIIISGLLTGTVAPSASRYSVVTKSPLTNIWAQSSSGGRCGVGAVMGSKKLKAIAVYGDKKIQIADKEMFHTMIKKQIELLGESILGAGLQGYGTNLVMDMANVCGSLPTRNWQKGTCKFMGMALDASEWTDTIKALTGWNFGVTEFRKIGERIYNLERTYNIREGLSRKDDMLPERLQKEPLPDGPAQGHVNNPDTLLDTYYELRGWDKKTGKPGRKKLKELGLEYVIAEIYGKGT